MGQIGTPELLVILGIAVLLFGVGRIGKIGGELGSAVRAFREGMQGANEKPDIEDKKTEQS